MTITSFEKTGQTGSFRFDLNEITDTYLAISDDPSDGPLDILALPACPNPGDLYPGNSAYIVRETIPQQRGDGSELTWDVEVRYDNQALTFVDPNPLNRDAVYAFNFVPTDRPFDIDLDGNWVRNSAGQLFNPPVTVPYYDLIVQVIKNEATYNAGLKTSVINRQNNAIWAPPEVGSIGVGQGLVTGIDGTPETENGVDFYRVTYTIALREDTWTLDVLDQGTVELSDTPNPNPPPAFKQIPIVVPDVNGNDIEVDTPWPLNGAGKAIRETAALVQLPFKAYEFVDFNAVIPT